MRRMPVSIAVALLVVLGAELAVRAVAPRLQEPLVWNNHEVQNKIALMRALRADAGGASTVFVGSSSMNAAADPALTDALHGASRPSFNAALNGSDMRSVEFWVTRVVVPALAPEVVVLGTTSLELNDNGITQADFYRRFVTSKGARRLVGDLDIAGHLEAWLEERSSLARYRTTLRRPGTVLNGDEAAFRGRVQPNGLLGGITEFQKRPYLIGEEFRRRTEEESYHDYSVGGPQVRALVRLAHWLERRDITFVVVKLPVTSDLLPMHPRGAADYETFERALGRFVGSNGVAFVDAAARIDDHRFFVDPIHLNAAGMRRFTEVVAPMIKGLVPDDEPSEEARSLDRTGRGA